MKRAAEFTNSFIVFGFAVECGGAISLWKLLWKMSVKIADKTMAQREKQWLEIGVVFVSD